MQFPHSYFLSFFLSDTCTWYHSWSIHASPPACVCQLVWSRSLHQRWWQHKKSLGGFTRWPDKNWPQQVRSRQLLRGWSVRFQWRRHFSWGKEPISWSRKVTSALQVAKVVHPSGTHPHGSDWLCLKLVCCWWTKKCHPHQMQFWWWPVGTNLGMDEDLSDHDKPAATHWMKKIAIEFRDQFADYIQQNTELLGEIPRVTTEENKSAFLRPFKFSPYNKALEPKNRCVLHWMTWSKWWTLHTWKLFDSYMMPTILSGRKLLK